MNARIKNYDLVWIPILSGFTQTNEHPATLPSILFNVLLIKEIILIIYFFCLKIIKGLTVMFGPKKKFSTALKNYHHLYETIIKLNIFYNLIIIQRRR